MKKILTFLTLVLLLNFNCLWAQYGSDDSDDVVWNENTDNNIKSGLCTTFLYDNEDFRDDVCTFDFCAHTGINDIKTELENVPIVLSYTTWNDNKLETLQSTLSSINSNLTFLNNLEAALEAGLGLNNHNFSIDDVEDAISNQCNQTCGWNECQNVTEVQGLQDDLADADQTIQTLQSKWNDLVSALSTALDLENASLNVSADIFVNAITVLKSDLSNKIVKLREKDNIIADKNERITELEGTVASKEEIITGLSTQLASKTQEYETLFAEYNELSAQLDLKTQEYNTLFADYGELESVLQETSDDLTVCMSAKATLEQNLSDTTTEYNNCSASLDDCQNQLDSTSSELQNTKGALNSTQVALTNTQQQKQALSAKKQELEEKVTNLTPYVGALDKTKKDKEQLEAILNSQSSQLKKQSDSITQLKNTLAQMEAKLAKNKSNTSGLEKNITKFDESLSQCNLEKDKVSETFKTTQEKLQKQLAELKKQNKALEEKYKESARNEDDESPDEEKKETSDSGKDKVNEEIKEYEERLLALNSMIKKQQNNEKEIETLKEKLADNDLIISYLPGGLVEGVVKAMYEQEKLTSHIFEEPEKLNHSASEMEMIEHKINIQDSEISKLKKQLLERKIIIKNAPEGEIEKAEGEIEILKTRPIKYELEKQTAGKSYLEKVKTVLEKMSQI